MDTCYSRSSKHLKIHSCSLIGIVMKNVGGSNLLPWDGLGLGFRVRAAN